MGEFDYFLKDIKLVRDINKVRNELFWNVDIPELSTFKELNDKFNDCLSAFEKYLMSLGKEDRGSVASLVIYDLIVKLMKAKTCVAEDKQAPDSVKSLCEVLEDGISMMLGRVEKLDIGLSDYLIKTMKELIRKKHGIMKKINGKIMPVAAEEGFFMARIFLPYLLNTNNINIFTPQKTDIKNDFQDSSAISLSTDEPQKTDIKSDFPEELNTEKAKDLFNKAIEFGLCEIRDGKYSWLKSKSLLAYFAEMASGYLKLGEGEYNGYAKVSWKPFEKIFSQTNLGNTRHSNNTRNDEPKGYKIVEKLFESLGYTHKKRNYF